LARGGVGPQNHENSVAVEFVYGEGLLRQEKQCFFVSILASSSFQAMYARLQALYPVFPFVNFAIDTV